MNFRNFITESKDMLDISILHAKKYLTSDKRIEEFLNVPVVVEHKTDGIKITLIYKDNTGDFTKDWIVSYKNEIQYPAEFDFTALTNIKKHSTANAQFKIIFEHLKKITPGLSGIPKSTEFFVEFLMKKSTLSSNYKKSHGMVLIAYSKTSFEEKFGKLKSSPSSFNTNGREKYADLLGLDVPLKLFDGVLMSFENGIINKELKSIYATHKNSIDFSSIHNVLQNVSEMFLAVESKYGGKEEGVVIIFKDGSRILKFQQAYQTDQTARKDIKNKSKENTEELENQFWDNVRLTALNIIKKVQGSKPIKYIDYPDFLKDCAQELKKEKISFTHSKKTAVQIKDDVQGNIKMISRKSLKGNNNFLFLGKYRILTKAHYDIIKKGLRKYDNGTVCIVTSSDTKKTKDLRTKMVQKAFPEIEVVHHGSGNLFGIINKSSKNINVILAGSDRVASYRSILSRNPDMIVQETKRTGADISASKVIENINDEKYFKKNTPKEIHSMYSEILKEYA